jgi:hypothetical protein
MSANSCERRYGWGARIRTWEWRNQNPRDDIDQLAYFSRLGSKTGVQHQWDTDEFPTTQRTTNDPSPAAWIVGRNVHYAAFLRPLVQSLQYVRTILAAVKSQRLGEPTVQDLRQPESENRTRAFPPSRGRVFRGHAAATRDQDGQGVLSEFLV